MSQKQKMMICRNCNAPIAKNAKICPSCGVRNTPPFYKRWWFVLIIIFIAIGAISSIGRNRKETFGWKNIELCNKLPEPRSNMGVVFGNSSDELDVHVEQTSEGDYKKYVSKCQTLGYSIESEIGEDQYHAFNEEGYELSLSYVGETMYIELVAPKKMEAFKWPKSEIASLLPRPKSSVGKVSNDASDGCYIYVGETSIDDFNAYIDECAEKGFAVNYERSDKYYNADDENGNHISVVYQGNHVMSIEIKKLDGHQENWTEFEPEIETSNEEEPKETESLSDNTESVDGMRPEFKKAMDGYEEFMNQYCDFIKKYAESDGTDLGLLADYADYMSKYAEVLRDFEAWNSKEMNTTEAVYYLEVQIRINAKLLEVGE